MDRSWGVTGTLTFMTPNSVTSRGTGHTKKEEALGNPRRFDTQYLPLYNTKDSTRGYCVAQASTDDDTHKNFFSDFYPPVYFVYSPYLKSHNSPFYWNFFSLDFTWLVCDTQLMRLAAISHACDDLPVSLYIQSLDRLLSFKILSFLYCHWFSPGFDSTKLVTVCLMKFLKNVYSSFLS